MYNSYPAARLLLGSGLLFLSIISQSMLLYAVLMLLSIAMMRVLDGQWLTIVRLLRLLRWFVIPVLLLHTLLSPGQLLMPGGWLPISQEGLVRGLYLSLHLSVIFFTAMLMFRLLQRAEWLRYVLLLPWVGKKLAVYVWMMASMHLNITALLYDLRMQFRLRRDWQRAPLLLMAAFKQALVEASEHASLLWLRWPEQMPLQVQQSVSQQSLAQQSEPLLFQYRLISVLSAGLGCAAFALPWL